jgi:hypothetical protein
LSAPFNLCVGATTFIPTAKDLTNKDVTLREELGEYEALIILLKVVYESGFKIWVLKRKVSQVSVVAFNQLKLIVSL